MARTNCYECKHAYFTEKTGHCLECHQDKPHSDFEWVGVQDANGVWFSVYRYQFCKSKCRDKRLGKLPHKVTNMRWVRLYGDCVMKVCDDEGVIAERQGRLKQ